ncbi:MAG: DUF1320 domain-containing protein [Pseudomonadota bacterium]
MPYATPTDIAELYGAEALAALTDRDGDGTAEPGAVERALGAASEEMDRHIAVRYTVPLPETTPALAQLCTDIAVYRLAHAARVLRDEHRTRYEDAMRALKAIAKGEQVLPFPRTGAEDDRPNPILVEGPDRIFTRDDMGEL